MVTTTLLAYLLIGVFLYIDRHARQGPEARSLARGQYDRGSTPLVAIAFAVSVLALLAAPLLNQLQLGRFPLATWTGWMGIVLMGLSLVLRV